MLKKIIALLSTAAMLCSLAVTVSADDVPYAETSINPTFSIQKEEETNDDGEYVYNLVVEYEGDEMSSTKKSGKYTGYAFTMIQIEIDHPEDDGIWAEGEQGSWTDLTSTRGQYLFQGGNGTYYAVASGDPVCTIYTAGDIDEDDFVIDFAKMTIDTFAKNVTSIQTNYSTEQANIDSGVAHYLAYIGGAPAAKTLSSIALASTETTVDGGAEVTLPAVTATYSDDSTAPVTATWTNAAGETITSFTAPEATTEVQTVVLTASYTEGDVTKTATYTVTVNAKKINYGATAGEEYYLSNDGTTKDVVVKSWNVVAANDGDGSIDLTFTSGDDEKVFALTHDVKGEAAIEFVALLLNAPADVTLTVPVE